MAIRGSQELRDETQATFKSAQGQLRKRAKKVRRRGILTGLLGRQTPRQLKLQERADEMARATRKNESVRAESTFKENRKLSSAEDQKVAALRSEGLLEEGSLKFSDTHWKNAFLKSNQAKFDNADGPSREQFFASNQGQFNAFKGGQAKSFVRTYKSSTDLEAGITSRASAADARLAASLGRSQSPLENLVNVGSQAITGQDVFTGDADKAAAVAVPLPGVDPLAGEQDTSRFAAAPLDPSALPETPQKFEFEDPREVEFLDDDQNVVPGTRTRARLDQISGKTFIDGPDGKLVEITRAFRTVDKEKTGVGAAKKFSFKSALLEKDLGKKLSGQGRAIVATNDLLQSVRLKVGNPKDFLDITGERIGNTVAAILGFDDTESEAVTSYLNARTPEEREIVSEALGIGVQDAIDAGVKDQNRLVAQFAIAKMLQGSGKLTVTAMTEAAKLTDGSGGNTRSLARLEKNLLSTRKAQQRAIMTAGMKHNIELLQMPPSAGRAAVERTQGYPVYTALQYRKLSSQLDLTPNQIVIDRLNALEKAGTIFRTNSSGIQQVPSLLRVTNKDGTEGFSMGIVTHHYE